MLKHLDDLMIINGGCDPYHYLKGHGGLGYKPSQHYPHGVGILGRGFYEDGVWHPYDKKRINKTY